MMVYLQQSNIRLFESIFIQSASFENSFLGNFFKADYRCGEIFFDLNTIQ